jgi:cobaltochelatase CobT
MENARCEAVGARDMPGTAGNIDAKIANEADRKGYGQMTQAQPTCPCRWQRVISSASGDRAATCRRQQQTPPDLWRGFVEDHAGARCRKLDHVLADQAAFARLARKVIADLGYGDQLGDDPDAPDEDDAGNDEAEEDQDAPDSQGTKHRNSDESEASPERSRKSSKTKAQAQVTMEDSADMEQGDEAEMPEGEAPLEPPPPAPYSDADPNYTVYTTDFDEEIKAEDLAEPAELERLRAYLDQQLEPLKGAVSAGWRTSCSVGCKPSKTAAGTLTRRKASSTQGGWPVWWRTRRLRCPSSGRRTPSSAIPA